MKKIPIIFMLTLLVLSACRKDSDEIKVITVTPEPGILVETSISGQVLNADRTAVAGAVVNVANGAAVTDAQGRFEFKNITVVQDAPLIATKNGFFDGSSKAYSRAGIPGYTEIILTDKGTPKTLSADAGGTVDLDDGSAITFAPNSFRTANGDLYTGSVKVYSKQASPLEPDFALKMDGDLKGKDSNGDLVGLAPLAQMTIELEGTAGEELETAEGMEAEISMEIPQDLLTDAPQEIPLWSFDPLLQTWLQVGTCNLVNTHYVGYHIAGSSVVCSNPTPIVHVFGNVFYANEPAAYHRVTINDLGPPHTYIGFTDSLGFYCGYVSKDSPLRIGIRNFCVEEIYNDNIGPYSSDTNIPDISIPNTPISRFLNASGYLQGCDGTPLNENTGFIGVFLSTGFVLGDIDANGYFDLPIPIACTEFPEVTIVGYEKATKTHTAGNVYFEEGTVDLGIINACTPTQDSMVFVLDGVDYFLFPSSAYPAVGTNGVFSIVGTTGNGNVSLLITKTPYNGVGVYDGILTGANIGPTPFSDSSMEINITADDGEYIIGNASGVAGEPNGGTGTHPYTINFKARKF